MLVLEFGRDILWANFGQNNLCPLLSQTYESIIITIIIIRKPEYAFQKKRVKERSFRNQVDLYLYQQLAGAIIFILGKQSQLEILARWS